MYIESGSNLAISYSELVAFFAKLVSNDAEDEAAVKKSRWQILDTLRYIKNYEGPLSRNGETNEKYRFSDEREWRFVPKYSEKCKIMYSKKRWLEAGIKEEAAASIANMRLNFEPNDVKYIIIKNDDEISEFIDVLKKAKGKTYSHDDVERLTTRLLTSEQIHSDF